MAGLQAKANGFSGEIAGCVRIASPETIGTHILLPGLRPFLERHPRLQIELNTGVALIGMARGEADIAVRLVRPERGALAVRKVGTMGQGLYGLPGTRATLATDRLVGWPDTFDLPAARWLRQVSGREPDIRLNHLAAHEAAIRAGLGIGVLPHFLADGLELVASPPLPSETLWLIALADGLAPGRIRSVYEEVAELLLRWSTRLENPGPGPRVAPPGDSTSLHEETKIVT
jgi:DNA-binding transcriptional LysR family regulator